MKKETSQNLISAPVAAFSGKQFAADGYSTHMNFVYDKKAAASRRLKEWDFYQIQCGNTVLQLTLGHISRAGQISANLIDISTGQKAAFSKTVLNAAKVRRQLSANPEKPNLTQWFSHDLKLQFEVTPHSRRLTLSYYSQNRICVEIDVTLTNVSAEKEKAVVAVPFDDPKCWYLNYKENCFVANGYARICQKEAYFKNGTAVLDWGRGVWPKQSGWVWGNGSTSIAGVPFGFNIGWGFGNSQTTENMFFYDNKAYKLGKVTETSDADGVYRYADEANDFVFEATALWDNFTQTRAPSVNNCCHQVFGTWRGTVKLPDGKKIKVPPFVAFCEHAENKW